MRTVPKALLVSLPEQGKRKREARRSLSGEEEGGTDRLGAWAVWLTRFTPNRAQSDRPALPLLPRSVARPGAPLTSLDP